MGDSIMVQDFGARSKLCLVILVFVVALAPSIADLHAEDNSADRSHILKKAEDLVVEKKYYSAFIDLQEADTENTDVEITLKKLQIVLEYFVFSFNHHIFSLTDLEPHQKIEDIRGEKGTYQMVSFDPPEVLDSLIKMYPEDFRIQKAMGEYYAEVLMRYGGRWELSDEEIISLSRSYYSQAMENGVVDSRMYFQLGYYNMLEGNWPDGIEMLKKAVRLDETYDNAHYNLAYAYLQLNKRQKSIVHAGKALELYESPGLKGDAARMLATIHGELGEKDRALDYYRQADDIDPGNYYTLRSLINIYTQTGRMELASIKSKELFDLDPDNPTAGQEIIKAYFYAKASDDALIVMNELESKYGDNSEIMGNILFHEALLLDWEGNKEAAVDRMNGAEKHFKKSLEPGHAVFRAIDDFLNK